MTTTTPKTNFPATKTFVAALIQACTAKGYAIQSLDSTTESGLKENGGWCFLRLEGTHEAGASFIIPKAVHRLGNIHSHVDLQGHDGYIPLPKKNGKVICHLVPDLAKVVACLPMLLSAAKRATAAPTPKATVTPPLGTTVVATVAAPTTDLVTAAEAVTPDSSEAAEYLASEQELELAMLEALTAPESETQAS